MCSSLTLMDAPMAGRTDVRAGRTARGAAIGRWPRPAGGEGAGNRGLDRSSGKGRKRRKHESGRNSLPSVRAALSPGKVSRGGQRLTSRGARAPPGKGRPAARPDREAAGSVSQLTVSSFARSVSRPTAASPGPGGPVAPACAAAAPRPEPAPRGQPRPPSPARPCPAPPRPQRCRRPEAEDGSGACGAGRPGRAPARGRTSPSG